jgi:hypothetical protein
MSIHSFAIGCPIARIERFIGRFVSKLDEYYESIDGTSDIFVALISTILNLSLRSFIAFFPVAELIIIHSPVNGLLNLFFHIPV